MVTAAMKASTIAEIFVQEDQIRVQIEVGGGDWEAFQDLLPDELYERQSGKREPLETRLTRFLREGWVMTADGEPLRGRIADIVAARRVVRDDITGEPMAVQPDDAELVIRVELLYELNEKPTKLSIRPPRRKQAITANIGFVLYHDGVAVNDFRYLSQEETVRLDWNDAWYSEFERRNLRRRFFSPAAGFIYVENFEVRKEILFRPKDLQEWTDLGLAGKTAIAAGDRDSVRERAATFLNEHTPLRIDGQRVDGVLDRIHFVQRTLRTTGVVSPEKDIDLKTAMLGAIYVYPIDSLPTQVAMHWDLFNDRITQIPCVATDEAGGMPGTLDSENPDLIWQNYLKRPTVPAFLKVATPTPGRRLFLPIGSLLCIAVAVLVVWRAPKSVPTIIFAASLVLLGLSTVTWKRQGWDIPIGPRASVSQEDAGDVVYSLLHNVYRAFDYRDESTVYDVLARSAAGDLLNQVYLETRQSLTLANQGGARVKVKAIDMIDCQLKPSPNDLLVADCTWNVTGNVGHWGHLHQRSNQYRGELTLSPIDGQWKITKMDVLSEERL